MVAEKDVDGRGKPGHDDTRGPRTGNAVLTRVADCRRAMVSRTRIRAILTTLGLYVMAALLIGYFGMHAFTGEHGLKAKEDLALQLSSLAEELQRLKTERLDWQRRVAL